MTVINNKLKKDITILLTSAGGLTGVFLSKHYRENNNYRIIATDMSDVNPLIKWVDRFYKVPPVKDKMYLPMIEKILEEESVDILIPTTSYDVDFFSRENIRKKIKSVKILTMDYDDYIMLHDKESCYRYLETIGISTPTIFSSIQEIEYPCIIKPKRGTGSKETVVIQDISDYKYWVSRIKDNISIQYLKGSEYTVDCLFDLKGKCLGSNVRERVKSVGGGATVTRNNNIINIDPIIKKLENTNKIKGPINFQFKVLPNDELCVFDFNTRFASGGLPLTVKSGFDIPNMLIKILLGQKVEKWEIKQENNNLTMIKYYEEHYVNAHD